MAQSKVREFSHHGDLNHGYVAVYQRVNPIKSHEKPPRHHHFPIVFPTKFTISLWFFLLNDHFPTGFPTKSPFSYWFFLLSDHVPVVQPCSTAPTSTPGLALAPYP